MGIRVTALGFLCLACFCSGWGGNGQWGRGRGRGYGNLNGRSSSGFNGQQMPMQEYLPSQQQRFVPQNFQQVGQPIGQVGQNYQGRGVGLQQGQSQQGGLYGRGGSSFGQTAYNNQGDFRVLGNQGQIGQGGGYQGQTGQGGGYQGQIGQGGGYQGQIGQGGDYQVGVNAGNQQLANNVQDYNGPSITYGVQPGGLDASIPAASYNGPAISFGSGGLGNAQNAGLSPQPDSYQQLGQVNSGASNLGQGQYLSGSESTPQVYGGMSSFGAGRAVSAFDRVTGGQDEGYIRMHHRFGPIDMNKERGGLLPYGHTQEASAGTAGEQKRSFIVFPTSSKESIGLHEITDNGGRQDGGQARLATLGQSGNNFGQTDSSYGQAGSIAGQTGSGFGQAGSGFGQTGSSFGQAGSGFGQTGSTFGQTDSNYGQTGSTAGQTGSNYGQTGRGVGQTGSGFGQTGRGVGQTGSGFGQTGSGFGQTGSGFGQAGSGFGQTDSSYGQTGSTAGQTGSNYGQTGSGAGQTGSGFGQTGRGVGQTGSGFGQTGSGVGQTGNGFGQTDNNYGQTGSTAGQTGSNYGQTGRGVGQTGSGFGQTGRGVGQTGSNYGQTGSGVGQTGNGFGQTDNNYGQTGSTAGQTGSNYGQTGSGVGQTGNGFGQTDNNYGQTGSNYGQTGRGVGQTGSGFGQTGRGVGQTGSTFGQTGGNYGQTGNAITVQANLGNSGESLAGGEPGRGTVGIPVYPAGGIGANTGDDARLSIGSPDDGQQVEVVPGFTRPRPPPTTTPPSRNFQLFNPFPSATRGSRPDRGQSGGGQSGGGQSGGGQSGGGQSGGGQSGRGQSGRGQSGGGQSGGGQSGRGQSGGGQSGRGQSGGGQSGGGQSGGGQSGRGQSGQGQSGRGQSGRGQSGSGQSGRGQSGSGQSGRGQGSGTDDSQLVSVGLVPKTPDADGGRGTIFINGVERPPASGLAALVIGGDAEFKVESSAEGKQTITDAVVTCDRESNTITATVTLSKDFDGLVYAKGNFKVDQCRIRGNNGRQVTISLPLDGCGTTIKNGVDEYGGTVSYKNSIVVMNEAELGVIEEWDKAIALACDFAGAVEQTVRYGFGVPMLQLQEVTSEMGVPTCFMSVIEGESPIGTDASELRIGALATLVVTLMDSEHFDVSVFDCFAHDGMGMNRIQLIDENGCSANRKIIGQQEKRTDIIDDRTMAFARFKAFKFPDIENVYYECQCRICFDQCHPQTCGSRKKREAPESKMEERAAEERIFNGVVIIMPEEDVTYAEPEKTRDSSELSAGSMCLNKTDFTIGTTFLGAILFGVGCAAIVLLYRRRL